jgi:GNAT superfamily N-acetyltransferase
MGETLSSPCFKKFETIPTFTMSLYTLTNLNSFPAIKKPTGLTIEESTDIQLLAILGNTTVDDVRSRLANDHSAFVAYINNQPAAFGWMARGKAKIGELNHEFVLPQGNRYLWNFRTLEAFRGLGIYPALLQYILQFEKHKANRFWIIHAPENNSSLKGIRKAGFEYVGKLYSNNGIATLENNSLSGIESLLAEMDIIISEEQAASRWNCSSPYLKKRKAECCCSASGVECVGNNLLSLAS